MEERLVVIIGAGPAGLAVAACLTLIAIPYILLEKEDCYASLWNKRTYDRCHLHLAKEFCSLPFKPHASNSKRFMSREDFIRYIDIYVSHFGIRAQYNHYVECASFDETIGMWEIKATNSSNNISKKFLSTFLVVATGENGKGIIPDIPGVKDFKGEILHSSQYKSGLKYQDKKVLVVGSGNSGMEIAYDLANCGAETSIVIRNPFHVVTREMVWVGMHLLKYLPITIVDSLIKLVSNIKFGDLSNFGIHRPEKGPFFLKATIGRSPVIDVGTVDKIKAGKIKVQHVISRIDNNRVIFEDKSQECYDVIIFATGYKSTICEWLKDYKYHIQDNGFPKNCFPDHWKGHNRLYYAGLSRMGLQGVSIDAQLIANDIRATLLSMKKD